MTPEAKARQLTDQKLEEAGWVVQDRAQMNPSAGRDAQAPRKGGKAKWQAGTDAKPRKHRAHKQKEDT